MATISKVKIANMALASIGTDSTIESFTENSAEAAQINLWYDYSRIQALEAFDWSFARKRQTLTLHSEDAPDGVFGFRYQYPDTAVTFRKMQNPLGDAADNIPYLVEMDATGNEKTILTDLEDAIGVFTFDLTSTPLFSAHFVRTLASAIAANIAYPLTGKTSVQDRQVALFRDLVLIAPAQNANENQDKPPRDAEWIRARGVVDTTRNPWPWLR